MILRSRRYGISLSPMMVRRFAVASFSLRTTWLARLQFQFRLQRRAQAELGAEHVGQYRDLAAVDQDLGAQHEHRLRQGLGREPVFGEDGHAVGAARRAARRGVAQVMEALAVGMEAALVVARARDRHVDQRQQGHHLAKPARVADADGPRAGSGGHR